MLKPLKNSLHVVPVRRDNLFREVLQAAALMHDVGKAAGSGKHQKKSYRMIRGLPLPLGWGARELELAAVVARYHRGALPSARRKSFGDIGIAGPARGYGIGGNSKASQCVDLRHAQVLRLEVGVHEEGILIRMAGLFLAGPVGGGSGGGSPVC